MSTGNKARWRPLDLVGNWFGGLKALLGPPASVRACTQTPRLGRLMQLENRRLLSATPVGTAFLVNTTTQGAQQTSTQNPQNPQAVAVNPVTGAYVVTWSSNGAGGVGWDVYAQMYNANGTPQGNQFLVNTTTTSDQNSAAVAMDPSGNFVITWQGHQSGHWQIYAQQYNGNGTPQGTEFQVSTPSTADQQDPSVAVDGSGNFVITWSSNDAGSTGWNVYAQRFDAAGNAVGTQFEVNATTTGDQEYSSVAMDPAGSFVITWAGHQSGHWQIYAQQYNADGTLLGSEFQVNTPNTVDQQDPSVALDGSGNFVITWSSNGGGPNNWDVYAQQYNAAGNTVGGEFLVNTTTSHEQEYASVAMDASGTFVITWSSNDGGSAGWNVYAQQYDTNGAPLGTQFEVNTFTTDNQQYSSAALADNGQLVIVWNSNNQDGNAWGIYGQMYSLSGITVTPASGLETTQAGGQASFSVALSSQPLNTVTVSVSSSDPTQGTPSVSTLTFTSANWNQAQTVTVTGQNNGIAGPDQPYSINLTAASGDTSYNGTTVSVALTNLNEDQAGYHRHPCLGLANNPGRRPGDLQRRPEQSAPEQRDGQREQFRSHPGDAVGFHPDVHQRQLEPGADRDRHRPEQQHCWSQPALHDRPERRQRRRQVQRCHRLRRPDQPEPGPRRHHGHTHRGAADNAERRPGQLQRRPEQSAPEQRDGQREQLRSDAGDAVGFHPDVHQRQLEPGADRDRQRPEQQRRRPQSALLHQPERTPAATPATAAPLPPSP